MKIMISKKNKKNSRGFTLVELLVAMGIFMAVTGIVSTSFIKSMRAQKTSVALMSANDGIVLALEQMARELRTGSDFSEAQDDQELTFVNYKKETVKYTLSGGAIEKEEINPDTLESRKERITPDTARPGTSGASRPGSSGPRRPWPRLDRG